jgi:hypothetical protein
MAAAAAYPEAGNERSTILAYVIDRPGRMDAFLSELRDTVPGARVSLKNEEVVHLSPSDSLPRGALRTRPPRGGIGCLVWVCTGVVVGLLALL